MGLLSGLGRMAPLSFRSERLRASAAPFASPSDMRDPGLSAYDETIGPDHPAWYSGPRAGEYSNSRMEAGTDLGFQKPGEDDPSYWAEQGKSVPNKFDAKIAQAGLSMMDEATPDQPDYMQVRRGPRYQRQTAYSYKPYGQY